LGFRICSNCLIGRHVRQAYPAGNAGSTTGQSAIRHHAGKSLSKFHPARINRLQASQIAAALLFDLGTVDIR
jgi:hypothetical protein